MIRRSSDLLPLYALMSNYWSCLLVKGLLSSLDVLAGAYEVISGIWDAEEKRLPLFITGARAAISFKYTPHWLTYAFDQFSRRDFFISFALIHCL